MPECVDAMPAAVSPHYETADEHIARLRSRVSELTAALAGSRLASESPYFTRAEAAAYCRCHPRKIDRLLAAGRLTRRKFGREVLIRKSELERLVES